MKILHLSDTHGRFPELEGDFDLVIHTGDMLPNRTFGIREVEHTFQKYWLEIEAAKIHHSWHKAPVVYVPGNHDYVDPTPYLRDVGIDAKLACNGVVEVTGVTVYGFPWTPVFYDWNWMCGELEMTHHMSPLAELMDVGLVDVVAAHGPMFGVLDRNRDGERCGSKVVRKAVMRARHPPRAFLHGHIHEAAGIVRWGNVLVSNAACTQRIVEV